MVDTMQTTKKLLVAFDPSKPDAGRGDFLAPVSNGERVRFLGLRSKKQSVYGCMVYAGKEVSVNDVFAKLVDAGHTIPSVDATMQMLSNYIEVLQDFKIGNVLAIESDASKPNAFQLVKFANTPSGAIKAAE